MFGGGPYSAFGGTDASRGLATFSVTGVTDVYDDLSDLNSFEMDSVREWEMQFTGIFNIGVFHTKYTNGRNLITFNLVYFRFRCRISTSDFLLFVSKL